jgi:SPP1 family predicted phage head-tail adaptor
MAKCCDITSGMLRTTVSVEAATRTSDGAGGYTTAWAARSGAPTRAHVQFKSGSELMRSDRIEAKGSYRVTMRYNSGVTESDRIVIKGRSHNIRAIDNVEMRDKWLILHCELGVPV